MLPIGVLAAVAALVLVPAGSSVPQLRACTVSDLHGAGQLQGATGSMLGPIVFRNVSSLTCSLGGRPHVSIFTRSGHALRTREEALTLKGIGYRRITALRSGQRAWLYLQWSEWCGSWPRGAYVRKLTARVSLTTDRSVKAGLESGRPRCDVHTGSRLGVSPFGAPR